MASTVVGLGRRAILSYPRYRNSGVVWLGEVPEHWEVKRLDYVASYRTSSVDKKVEEDELPIRLCNYTDVYYGERIRASQGEFMDATASTSEVERFRLLVGDILVTKDSEDWRDIAVPAIVDETADDFVCGYHLGLIRSGPSVHPLFLYRALQSVAVNRQLQISASGVTRYGLPNGAVGDIVVPLPPIDEQRAIANLLDRETERIDSLSAKMRLLIERLSEYRIALITHTVTRGLPAEAASEAGVDPSPRLKPSGVEWLGEVPEHWEVKRLDYVASYRTSSVDKKVEEDELPIRLCNYTDVYYGERIRASQGEFMDATASTSEVERFRLLVGDILVTKDSEDWRDIAVPAIVDETADDFVCGYHLGLIRSGPSVHPLFLYRALQSVAVNRQLQISASGVTRYGLPNGAVGDIVVPLPPIDEQRAIANLLDRETERIDSLSAKMRLLIERLSEYRIALITAAVTGKIEVRASGESPKAHLRGRLR